MKKLFLALLLVVVGAVCPLLGMEQKPVEIVEPPIDGLCVDVSFGICHYLPRRDIIGLRKVSKKFKLISIEYMENPFIGKKHRLDIDNRPFVIEYDSSKGDKAVNDIKKLSFQIGRDFSIKVEVAYGNNRTITDLCIIPNVSELVLGNCWELCMGPMRYKEIRPEDLQDIFGAWNNKLKVLTVVGGIDLLRAVGWERLPDSLESLSVNVSDPENDGFFMENVAELRRITRCCQNLKHLSVPIRAWGRIGTREYDARELARLRE